MKNMTVKTKSKNRILAYFSRNSSFWTPLFWSVCFFIGLWLYYLLYVNPQYIRFHQMPSFFVDQRYFTDHLNVPGGFLDVVAAYLTDLFQYGWLGGAILAGLVLLSLLLFNSILRPRVWWMVSVVPVILLMMAQAKYDFGIVKILALILGMEGFLIFQSTRLFHGRVRFAVGAVSVAVLYLCSPLSMIVFALFVSLHEAFNTERKFIERTGVSLGYLLFAAALPWMASKTLFLINLRNAYLRHTPLWNGDRLNTISIGDAPLDGIALLLMVVFFGVSLVPKAGQHRPVLSGRKLNLIQAIVVILLLTVGGWRAIDVDMKEYLAIRHAAHHRNWDGVLTHVSERTAQNSLSLFHFNRALYNTGKMGSDFFSIPRGRQHSSLFLDTDTRFQSPLDYSDFFYELGHINEAKRWASEALTLYGETSDVLKQLALISIVSGEFKIAEQYLNRLRQNPLQNEWAEHYLACATDRTKLRAETGLRKLHELIPRNDFIVLPAAPDIDLEKILRQSPNNRMAFEYLMMSHLISRDLHSFTKSLLRYDYFTKGKLPRHYEEALLIYFMQKAIPDSTALKIGIRQTTVDDFHTFKRRLAEHGGNKETAYWDLRRHYANTYWFYTMFYQPNS